MNLNLKFIIGLFLLISISCTKQEDKDKDKIEPLGRAEISKPSTVLYGENLIDLDFDWNDVENVTKYKAVIKNIYNGNIVIEEFITNSDITVNRSSFIDGETYQLTITSINDTEETTSMPKSFTYVFGKIQLLAPLNNTIFSNGTSSIQLKCEDVSFIGITQYRFTVYRDGGFLVTQQNSSINQFSFTNISNNTIYTWDVSATKSSGGSLVSNTFSFQTE